VTCKTIISTATLKTRTLGSRSRKFKHVCELCPDQAEVALVYRDPFGSGNQFFLCQEHANMVVSLDDGQTENYIRRDG